MKKSKSRKVLMDDGPRQIAKGKKAVAWDFRGRSFAIPISLTVDENRKDLTVRCFTIINTLFVFYWWNLTGVSLAYCGQAKYKKDRMILMKVFKGSYKVEPLYVDSERLCKHMEPKSPEEYKNVVAVKEGLHRKWQWTNALSHIFLLVCRHYFGTFVISPLRTPKLRSEH